MTEQSFILIKPDHVDQAENILKELDQYGQRIVTVHVASVAYETIAEHYAGHRGRPYYEYMVQSFVGKPVVIAVFEGGQIRERLIDAIGPTDPRNAPPTTIRGKYSNDSLERAIAEGRPVRNVIHRSDSATEAQREIHVWNSYFPDKFK